MAGKRYHAQNPSELQPHPFEIEVYRGALPEVHEFVARPNAELGPLIRMYKVIDDAMASAEIALKILVKQMDDQDGTPLDWEPKPLKKPGNAGENWEPKFRGPDGKLHTMDKAPGFLDPAKGSSRRRWQRLMLEDDGVSVDANVLMEIMQDLVSAAMGARPTPA